MHFRRLTIALIAATAITATAACGGGQTSTSAPLTLVNYKGADWVTNGDIKPPTGSARAQRITFPHTMDGAVMAAVNAQTLLDFANDATFGDIARDYFSIAPGLKDYITARSQLTTQGVDQAMIPRIKGFRFFHFQDSSATVEIFFQQPDASITGLTRNLVWLNDTWLIQIREPSPTEKVVKAYPALPEDINALPQT